MTDELLQALYRRAQERRAPRGGECPVSPEAMVDVLEGRRPEAERHRLLLEILGHPQCREEFELLRALHEARPAPRWTGTAKLAAAASVAVLISGAVLWTSTRREEARPDLPRGAELSVSALSPSGAMPPTRPLLFAWRPLAGASRYRAEVRSADGELLFATTTADTTFTLPDSVVLQPGEYRWLVQAELPDGAQARSAFLRFSIISLTSP